MRSGIFYIFGLMRGNTSNKCYICHNIIYDKMKLNIKKTDSGYSIKAVKSKFGDELIEQFFADLITYKSRVSIDYTTEKVTCCPEIIVDACIEITIDKNRRIEPAQIDIVMQDEHTIEEWEQAIADGRIKPLNNV